MPDLETTIREALRARADDVTAHDLRRPARDGQRPPRRGQWLLAAAAVLLVLAIAIPLAVSRSGGGTSAPATGGGGDYIGWKWDVTSVTDKQGRFEPPARLHLAIDFPAGGGHVGGNDGVNYCYGPMTLTGDGYDASEIACTAAGYGGNDPVVLRSIDDIDALFMVLNSADPVHVTAVLSGDTLTLSAGDVMVTTTRSEPEATAAPSSGTGSASGPSSDAPGGPGSASSSPGFSGTASP